MNEQQIRTAMLYGEEAVESLSTKRVAVFGLGGVGGYAVEALARSGIGQLDLIDHDTVSVSNMNRQILATVKTIGMDKVSVAADRAAQINPSCLIRPHKVFFLPETKDAFDFQDFDYVIDAVDTVTAKLLLIEACRDSGTPIISVMGTGNKSDPTAFFVSDILQTAICPLARVMRKELKKRGITHLTVVSSKESPIVPLALEQSSEGRRQTPGSNAFVPGVAGLIAAGTVIKDLLNIKP